jgi:hypothetical protein
MDKPIPLAASEIRLLKAARKLIDGGEPIVEVNHVWRGHDVSLRMAIDHCEKYFHGSRAAYRLARDRVLRRLGKKYFWSDAFLRENGYSVWRSIDCGSSPARIVPGNVSEETFNNWKVLANLAYIDRILETGEIK